VLSQTRDRIAVVEELKRQRFVRHWLWVQKTRETKEAAGAAEAAKAQAAADDFKGGDSCILYWYSCALSVMYVSYMTWRTLYTPACIQTHLHRE